MPAATPDLMPEGESTEKKYKNAKFRALELSFTFEHNAVLNRAAETLNGF
jgi:hypothetical protein